MKLGISHSRWSYETALVGDQAMEAVYLYQVVGSRGSGLLLCKQDQVRADQLVLLKYLVEYAESVLA